MRATLVDTNIWVDLFDDQSPWRAWSDRHVEQAKRSGPIVLNPIVYAELSAGFSNESLLADLFPSSVVREDLPWEAAFQAGRAFWMYRRAGGEKRSPLPDFYIGAHAFCRRHRILTRDVVRYRTYFPSVELIAPDTHP